MSYAYKILISSCKFTINIHHTSMDVEIQNLCHASKHMKCTFKCTTQVHELAPPTCVLKNFNLPLSFFTSLPLCHISSISLCFSPFMIFLPLFHYFYYYLCFSPPLSSMTTKVQNIDSISCRVKIINVNQWGEDQSSKFGSNQNICQRYLTRFDPRTSFFTPLNKDYLVPC